MINHPNRRRATKDKIAATTKPRKPTHNHEHDYSALLSSVRASFERVTATAVKLFQTDDDGLNELYLDSLPSERQVHNCHCCRRFIGAYGGLVAITENGDTVPVMWNPEGVPEFYRPAFAALYAFVKRARVTSVFMTNQAIWGTPRTGDWSHLSVVPPNALIYRKRLLTDGQAMAATKENYRTVITALSEFSAPMLDEAIRVLDAGALARSEKFVAPVKWLRTLQDRPKGRKGENVLWRAIADAPEGFCHPRSSVIGPLLEDIAAGMDFETIKARFNAKMGPLIYQRPQAAPTIGNIKAAEAIVEKMGIAPSLNRRFARLDDLQTVWSPTPDRVPHGGGVFGHLKAKNSDVPIPLDLPTVTMTWEKFSRTVLTNAERLELLVPVSGRFIALTTAAEVDAPPILKWDRDDERNPVAWYVYPNGSPARQWGLTGGSWAKVTAVSPFPNMWGSRPMPFVSDGIVLILDGATDTRSDTGNAIFPECLREELHGIRSTIEAYSRGAVLSGREEASACGFDMRKDAADCRLRAFSNGAWSNYRIDRWD